MTRFAASVIACVTVMVPSAVAFSHASLDLMSRRLVTVGFSKVGNNITGDPASLFGNAVSMTSNVKHLAVGAINATDPSNNEQLGAIFLYDADSSNNWIPGITIYGNSELGAIGESFSMSDTLADGDFRIAVRSTDRLKKTVQVYDSSASTIGSAIQVCSVIDDRVARTVTISPNGARLAVSCENENANAGFVKIFEWNGSGADWVEIGTLSGAPNDRMGWATSFNTQGNRLAISSVFATNGASSSSDQVGSVTVYEYKQGGQWTPLGNPVFGSQIQRHRFGGELALSRDGTTLVVSELGFGAQGIGKVFVYRLDASGNEWIQLGSAQDGTEAGDLFGRSIGVSESGSIFAASASPGYIRLFTYDGDWTQVGEDILGLGAERGSISLSSDGHHVAGGSGIDETVLVLYNLAVQSDSPSSGPTLPPSNAPSASTPAPVTPAPVTPAPVTTAPVASDSSNTPSSTPTHSPVASTPAPVTPIPVTPPSTSTPNLTTEPVTLTPSGAPSLVISAKPSFLPSNVDLPSASPSPTTSSVPSSVGTTTIPTVVLGKFDWDLERAGDMIIKFSSETSQEEITMSYSISRRTAIVQVFDANCTSLVDSDLVGISQQTIITSSTNARLDVGLDIVQNNIVDSVLWTAGTTNASGSIRLCVRVDLVLDDTNQTSVNFHEQKMELSISLSQGFTVESIIDLNRDAADSTQQEIDSQYNLTACQCTIDDNWACSSNVVVQGGDVFICVRSLDQNIAISEIEELDFAQLGGLNIAAIDQSTPDALTEVTLMGRLAVIRTQMRSGFFTEDNPNNVTATGSAAVTFVDGSRRNLRIHSHNHKVARNLQENLASSGFSVSMALVPTTTPPEQEANSKPRMGVIFGGIFGGLAAVALLILVAVVRRKKDEDEEAAEEECVDEPRRLPDAL